MLLVRPHNGLEALEITDQLLRRRGVGLLIFNPVTALHAAPISPSRMRAPAFS